MRLSPWTSSTRLTACGWSSLSTSRTCFTICACSCDRNGIETVLPFRRSSREKRNDPVWEEGPVRNRGWWEGQKGKLTPYAR